MLSPLKELVAAQLVVEDSTQGFGFRHALTQAAVLRQLLGRERSLLHRRVAVVLTQMPSAASDPRAAELAYHAFEAGSWEQAMAAGMRACARAQALGAPAAAAEQFTRVLEAAHQLGLAPPLSVLLNRGEAFEMLGNFDGDRTDFEDALSLARSSADRVSEWRAAMGLGLLWAGPDYARTAAYARVSLDLARELANPAMVAHSLNRLGNLRTNIDEPDEAVEAHREALAILETLHDEHGVAESLDLLGLSHCVGGDLQAGAATLARAIDLFQQLDERHLLASSRAVRLSGYPDAVHRPAAHVVRLRRPGAGTQQS